MCEVSPGAMRKLLAGVLIAGDLCRMRLPLRSWAGLIIILINLGTVLCRQDNAASTHFFQSLY